MSLVAFCFRAAFSLGVGMVMGGCGSRHEPRPLDVELLATDVYVAVAQQSLVLPFAAMGDPVSGGMSFSLNRKADAKRAVERRTAFLRETRNPRSPLALDLVSIRLYAYGASDFHADGGQLCLQLSRHWARAVCDGSLGPIRRALPHNGFKLLDLAQLRPDEPHGPANCLDGGKRNPPPVVPGRGMIMCPALVFGGDEDEFHTAVLRIDGNLGAVWTVWRGGRNGESAEAMAEREGRAIKLFVETALGEHEDYLKLQQGMADLLPPGG